MLKDSFYHINDWIDEITKYTGPNIFKLVLGNKSDLTSERKVTEEEIQVI
jgi:GTPase SAR1 family protein